MLKLTWLSTFVLGMALFLTVDAVAAITGNDWKMLQSTEQDMYLVGVYNGWQVMVVLAKGSDVGPISATDRMYTDMLACVDAKKMTYGQIAAITRQFMENNPSVWHFYMPDIFFGALQIVCPVEPLPERGGDGKKSFVPKARSGKKTLY